MLFLKKLGRIRAMFIKELIQIFRDPRLLGIVFVVPILQTLIFGYAVTMDIKYIPMAISDLDNTIESRRLISEFVSSGYFDPITYLNCNEEADESLNKDKALVVLCINRGFQDQLLSTIGQQAKVQMIVDGSDSNTAVIAEGYISKIGAKFSERIVFEKKERFQPNSISLEFKKNRDSSGITLESRVWFNEDLESRNFFVPGVVAILITMLTLTLTSMAIVREKEIGTIEQILVTPITRVEFILGKTFPFILIGFIEVIGILLISRFWFEVPIRGSIIVIFFAASLYLLTTLGIGLYISTISNTQQQALMSVFLFYFPAVLLSGFIYPISNMPEVIQWLTYFNPLKYFLIVIRGVFLKGVGWEILWPHLFLMGLMGFIVLWASIVRFKKTLN